MLVSGDVYDRALPPPDAVQLLSEALTRLIDAGATVVLSSGNHDSAIRLGFASGLLERSGLHIRSDVADVGRPVLVGDTAVYPLPYLEPTATSVTESLAVGERTHTAVLGAAMERVRADAAGRGPSTVVMAHCFASGGAASDSERDITTGGVAMVPASTFDGVAYTAGPGLVGALLVGLMYGKGLAQALGVRAARSLQPGPGGKVLVTAAAAPMIAGLVRAGRPSGVYAPSIAMSERSRKRYA